MTRFLGLLMILCMITGCYDIDLTPPRFYVESDAGVKDSGELDDEYRVSGECYLPCFDTCLKGLESNWKPEFEAVCNIICVDVCLEPYDPDLPKI